MAQIVVLGAGIGGISMTYELRKALGKDHRITLVNDTPYFQFTPSNPWVGVGWRAKQDITVELSPLMARFGVEFIVQAAKRVHPGENRLELADGQTLGYDYLVVATGPELAFDEIAGLGPDAHTQSVCTVDHATKAHVAWEAFCKETGRRTLLTSYPWIMKIRQVKHQARGYWSQFQSMWLRLFIQRV